MRHEKPFLIVLGIIIGILFLWWSSFGNSLSADNLELEYLRWLQCDCKRCPAEFKLKVEGIDPRLFANKEIQCKVMVDGSDRYIDNNSYYCDIERGLSSRIFLSPDEEHQVSVCCGTEGLRGKVYCIDSGLEECET